ncbi:uncharacterized protein MELLADRAFT_88529 [Melampsora larici-populina 98AG31]|uniref:Uncharacterized protein n=1 Tax=Melampsora larici-populina (strain 98AG31 / pathotype 3-4-7) TaxID=747676 RepID=F4RS33_MELLP|nr:uncharacterized protein MELLADRAFT_88529 [Melampsora larici-populina 98AG31]EGG04848.1 hypothetical protein MELLADRAFT_88529 [Melampsora larici-populina 98AG31]
MDNRLAATDARITRAGSVATGAQPAPGLDNQKRKRTTRRVDEEVEGEGNREEEREEIENEGVGGRAGGSGEAIREDAVVLSDDEADDGSWVPPPEEDDRHSGEESTVASQSATRNGSSAKLGHSTPGDILLSYVDRSLGARQPLEGKAYSQPENRAAGRHLDNESPSNQRRSRRCVVDGDRIVDIQGRIDELYARGDRTEAAALLAQFVDSFMTRERTISRQGSVNSQRDSPDPPNQPARRTQQEAPARQPQTSDRPQAAPYRLIQDDITEASADSHDSPEGRLPKRTKPDNPEDPSAATGNARRETEKSEAEMVEALLLLGKGRMVLANGDVVENGRLIVLDDSTQMEKSLPELSPVLTLYLQTFKAYIPLTVFERDFLRQDSKGWSTKKAPSASKMLEGNGIRIYGGDSPTKELTLQYEQWLDAITLFIRYVKKAGWETQSERFEGHKLVVMGLREDVGWMVALRYCQRVRKGVMRPTADKKIYNITTVQQVILDEVKLTVENLSERVYRTNPYAPGGPRENINQDTGLPKEGPTKKATPPQASTSYATTPYHSTSTSTRSEPWLPKAEYKAKKAAERQAARDQRNRRGRSPERSFERRDDRRRERSRSHDKGYNAKKYERYNRFEKRS